MRAIVVGGGLAGLTAAFRLQQRGAQVVVLEAHERAAG
jgi:protoporphyrinogen oxidase